MAARPILQLRCEDHVSPVLKALSDAMLTMPASMPALPDQLVDVDGRIGPSGLSVRMLPSAELLAWLAHVRQEG